MTNLSETQTKQAQDLIEQYGFCTFETQEELAKAGFFEKVKVNMCITFQKSGYNTAPTAEIFENAPYWAKSFTTLPMPQFHEVWAVLPNSIVLDGILKLKRLSKNGISYEYEFMCEYESICEAACQLWLKLHKKNLL